MDLLVLFVLFGLMWFFLIRPQQVRARAQRALVASIEAGDEVVTAGGIIGTVRVVDGDQIVLEVSPGVELRLLRAAVSRRLGPDLAGPGDVDEPGAEA